MKNLHTVEKIGGTSMSLFEDVLNNVIIANRKGHELYQRIFVVSAYGGITNLLLEDKKTGSPGVYALFEKNNKAWMDALENVRLKMIEFNRKFEHIGLDQRKADEFVEERLEGIYKCLNDTNRLRTYGHFRPENYLPASREILSSVGEAHCAYNSVLILKNHGINAVFIDLTGWMDEYSGSIEEMIARNLTHIDLSSQLPIITGYVKCKEGIMTHFDRGYSEITFSKTAVVTNAKEGIIHKEYHLCTGDPELIGLDKVKVIGNTNFDIADQLSDLEMEAIHSKASKEMELTNIPIRVKNAFEPDHPGTLISKDYISPNPRVEMICGRDDIIAIETFDPEMVGEIGYDNKLVGLLSKYKISYIAKSTNANTICHFIAAKTSNLHQCVEDMKKHLPTAQITRKEVAIVSVIGTNMSVPGFLSRASQALADKNINILGVLHCMRQVNIQFVVERKDFEPAQLALHTKLVESDNKAYSA